MRKTYRRSGIKTIILEHIENNLKLYLILTVIFFIGLVLGIMFVNNMKQEWQQGISQYLGQFIEQLNNTEYKISNIEILKEAVKNNFISFIILWFLGCMIIGTPVIYCFIMYKGFCLGYTVSAIIASIGAGKGLLFVFGTMLLQNIIYIPVYMAGAVSGINLHKNIMVDRKKEEIKINIVKHTLFSVMLLIWIFIGTIIESYISGGTMKLLARYF